MSMRGLIFVSLLLVSSWATLPAEASPRRHLLPKQAIAVPIAAQQTDYSCGAAVMVSLLEYWKGYRPNEKDLYAVMNMAEESTHPQGLVKGALAFGLSADLRTGMEIDDLTLELKNGSTVILDIQAWVDTSVPPSRYDWPNEWESGHYVILVAMSAKNAYFMDPYQPNGRYGFIPLAELKSRWRDYEIEDGKRQEYVQLAVVVRGDRQSPRSPGTRRVKRIK